MVSPKGVPRWWRDADRELRIGSGGWAVAVSACGLGRASASWALWRMAVGAALFPCSPGGLPHPGLMVAYGCSGCQGGMTADFGAIFKRFDWLPRSDESSVQELRRIPAGGGVRVNSRPADWGRCRRCRRSTGALCWARRWLRLLAISLSRLSGTTTITATNIMPIPTTSITPIPVIRHTPYPGEPAPRLSRRAGAGEAGH